MARIKITEYAAKKLLLGDSYRGLSLGKDMPQLPKKGSYVVKVDEGVKKRFLQGLVAVNVSAQEIQKHLVAWRKKGYSRFLVEPYVAHDAKEERYMSLERVREGVRVLYSASGGVAVEQNAKSVGEHLVTPDTDLEQLAESLSLPKNFIDRLVSVFAEHHFTFLEINPLVVRDEDVFLLDAAVLVDSAAASLVQKSWTEADCVIAGVRHEAEQQVRDLAQTTSASLSLKVLNAEGSIFFLLSGGGGSIVIADEAAEKGAGLLIGNYGEYSGGPSREETHLYTRAVLSLLHASKAKKKALVIAGGVANFTDIKSTFAGIIDALGECVTELQKQKVRIFVRRGGPNESAGLAHMEAYLRTTGLFGSVYGSDAPITSAIDDALSFVKK